MTFADWLSLAVLCLAGAASPGPSLAVVAGASMGAGRRAGCLAAWAHALGVGLYAAFTVLGISTLITEFTGLYRAVQIAGALYLLWLAWRLLSSTGASETGRPEDRSRHLRAARDGFAIAFLNPKLAVFMLALFSQFVRPDAPASVNAVLIGTVAAVDGLWYTLVALLFSARGWIDRLRRQARTIDRVFAGLLIVLALTILVRINE